MENKEPTDDELSKGTFCCPVCGLSQPHSINAHKVDILPWTLYGVPSIQKDFLVWVGADKQKALWMADFARNVIEYRRVDPSEQMASIERIAKQAEELGEYDKWEWE